MPYTVDRYNDNGFDVGWPISVADETVDNSTTLSLLGRGVTNYGEFVAENFVHLLENFTGTTPPANPITGQLWYDADSANPGAGILKVYNGAAFEPVGSVGTGTALPTNGSDGNLFFLDNGNNSRLYVYYSGSFLPLTGMTVSTTSPGSPNYGDLWWDTNVSPNVPKLYTPNGWEKIQVGDDGLFEDIQVNVDLTVGSNLIVNGTAEFNGKVKFNNFVAFWTETISSNKTLTRQITRCIGGVTSVTMPTVTAVDEGRFMTIINTTGNTINVNSPTNVFVHDTGTSSSWPIPDNTSQTFWLTRNTPAGSNFQWVVELPNATYN